MSRRTFNPGTLTAPLPPALVTVGQGARANVLTVAWTGILCSTPPKTYIAVRPSRHSHVLLMETGEFVIHLPSDTMMREVDYCGIYTGAKVDKFKACGFTTCESTAVGAPTIVQCPVALECRVYAVRSLGTHDVFEADIVSVSCDESLLDDKGKIHMERAHLLAYAHGDYYALGRRLGVFGCSTDKKKTVKRTAKPHAEKQKTANRENAKPKNKPTAPHRGKNAPAHAAKGGKKSQ